ncbi:MAG TPA: hypothetical protein VKH81_17465 [Candidatus Angelobacter sp.]|nr:hypothetical protein [Candidatus Angelobacter sp.]
MKMNHEAAAYVVRWFGHLMTPAEKSAEKHLLATMKAARGSSDVRPQREALQSKAHRRSLSHEADELDPAVDGYEPFVQRTAARIVKERGNEVFFNVCPNCAKLARTPRARECRWCGHDWRTTESIRRGGRIL